MFMEKLKHFGTWEITLFIIIMIHIFSFLDVTMQLALYKTEYMCALGGLHFPRPMKIQRLIMFVSYTVFEIVCDCSLTKR